VRVRQPRPAAGVPQAPRAGCGGAGGPDRRQHAADPRRRAVEGSQGGGRLSARRPGTALLPWEALVTCR
jgi:hypothetical protein